MRPLFSALLIWVVISTFSGIAQADLRGDAMAILAKLREEGIATRLPDEMRSLDATLATAEMYYQFSDFKNAERYYQLATQKGALIRQRLLASTAPPEIAPASPPASPASDVSKSDVKQPIPPPALIQQPLSSTIAPVTPSDSQSHRSTDSANTEQPELYSSPRLVGTVGTYTVVKGDTLRLAAAKLGVSRMQLAAMNGLSLKDKLKVGQSLHYNNRRIIPAHRLKDGLLINIPDRMLYLLDKGSISFATAVALGTPTKTEQLVWETPTGRFKIVNKAKDPTWTVPPSIQEEMKLEGKEIITSIPPGPENPLGKYAMKTSLPGILIHSTTRPWSIYSYSSHGCIRVYPERMAELFKLVKVNTPGEIIYRPVKLVVTDNNKVLLEVHSDIYKRTKGLEAEAKALIQNRRLADRVDWKKVKRVISRKAGVAEEITRDAYEAQQKSVTTKGDHSPS